MINLNNPNQLREIIDTLVTYGRFYEEAENNNTKRSHQPILVLESVKGERKIKLIKDRSELSFIQRVLAYFGFGPASLNSITTFLQTEFLKNRTFLELSLDDDNIFKCFQTLNEKIHSRNTSHWIQKINSILPTVLPTVKVINHLSAASTTYHPDGSNPKNDQMGVLDFAQIFPEFGTAYIADGTSHGKPEKRPKLEKLWQEFNETFVTTYKNSNLFNSQEQVQEFLTSCILELSNQFYNEGMVSTFSLSMLIEINGKKHVASIHAGDSTLLHVIKEGTVHRITPAGTDPANDLELSSLNRYSPLYFDIREVHPGDRIVGLTDGITKFLPEETLYNVFQNFKNNVEFDSENPNDLLTHIQKLIHSVTPEERIKFNLKEFDSKNPNGSDDISVFVMDVP